MTNSPRLAVITPTTVRVFEGRKFLAEYKVLGDLSVGDVEAARTATDALELTQENQS